MKRFVQWIMAVMTALLLGSAGAADLTLGSGDVIKISVYGSPDLGLETRISDSGAITFPLVGVVSLAGLTVPAAEKKLGGMLESGGFLKKPQINIIVTQSQSQLVSVLGQVNRPGRYPLDGRHSLMDLLATAGGIAAEGGDVVSVIRNRDGVSRKTAVDIVQMVRNGTLDQNLELLANDVIYVERAPRFYIYGEVQRPGTFRLERAMTVLQALSAGGGLTQRGTERGMRIKRLDAKGQMQVIDAKQDDLLQNDDVVYIKESLF